MKFLFITQVWQQMHDETDMYKDLVDQLKKLSNEAVVLLINKKRTQKGIMKILC